MCFKTAEEKDKKINQLYKLVVKMYINFYVLNTF